MGGPVELTPRTGFKHVFKIPPTLCRNTEADKDGENAIANESKHDDNSDNVDNDGPLGVRDRGLSNRTVAACGGLRARWRACGSGARTDSWRADVEEVARECLSSLRALASGKSAVME